ncbi:YjgN family protein [Brevundimonas faecalis]|uniref:YjgN family protein n=1 Tax=Brevundimonas faecalis TaxID=947378 RepID=UPI003614BB79
MTDSVLGGGAPDDGLGPLHGRYGDAGEEGEVLRFSSTIEPKRFLGLSLRNGLLNIVTLTLYRFWGKTEVRRRVWQGVRLNGDAFEYTGRGVELFIGFLLALVALGLPFLLIVFGVQFGHPGLILLLYPLLYLGLFWLWGFGVFTAFRYMASRTTWRGIRFRLGGSAKAYGLKYLGAVFLSGLTMGWYWPVAQKGLAEKLWDELRFGDRRIRFRMGRADKVGVYGWFALGWFGTGVLYVLLIAVMFAVMFATKAFDNPTASPSLTTTLTLYGGMLVLAPLYFLIWAPYHAAMMRAISAGVTLDGAGFFLDVRPMGLWWLTVSNLFLLLITLGFLAPWVQARTAHYLVTRLSAAGTAHLDLARQAGTGPGAGEGLADAFGFSLI